MHGTTLIHPLSRIFVTFALAACCANSSNACCFVGSSGHALAADPIDALGGIAEFAAALREGGTTSAAATRSYLERIAALEPQLQCFEVVLADAALATPVTRPMSEGAAATASSLG